AEELIADPLFALADFDKIFRGEDNKEEIFTFANLKEENGITFAGNFIQPATIYVPTPETIAQFASDDKRASLSVASDGDETVLYKYISSSTTDPIIISRLSEMYLISAEGKGVSGGGLDRLNELRAFRGLANVKPAPTTDAQLLDAVLAERRLEFLGEGFRWYDLVRTGKYMEKTGLPEKYTVFPLPQRELDLNKNLIQNTLWQ
ncbi:MAG: RagB/SusD family nutrient uptake outer membrane protein, partial [Bacteroidales bacterium]